MATIRTAIELYDAFTAPMMNIINAVNSGVSAMDQMQKAMNEPVSSAIVDSISDQMEQAIQAIEAARTALTEPVTHENTGITWDSPTMPTFTNSGVERFQQEVQSANNMLNTLNTTQERIAATAAQTDLFPAGAVADMNNMQNRLTAISQRIQAIESNPLNLGSDEANAELEQLRGQLDQAAQEQEALNRAVENMDVEAANQAYLRLSQTVGNTDEAQDVVGQDIRDDAQGRAGDEQHIQLVRQVVAQPPHEEEAHRPGEPGFDEDDLHPVGNLQLGPGLIGAQLRLGHLG